MAILLADNTRSALAELTSLSRAARCCTRMAMGLSRRARTMSGSLEAATAFAPPSQSALRWATRPVSAVTRPPPPRRPQKRSSFSVALAVRNRPSAVTTSADLRLSQDRPYLRAR